MLTLANQQKAATNAMRLTAVDHVLLAVPVTHAMGFGFGVLGTL